MMDAADDAEAYEDVYAAKTPPPWEIGRPQPVYQRLADSGLLRGHVLDLGCGTGEHALLAASLGHAATGLDTSAAGIARAREKAEQRGLDARFVVGDAFDLTLLGEQFETVLDVGLFHLFDTGRRVRLVDGLAAIMRPGGHYHLLGFSDQMPGTTGPRRLSKADVTVSFRSSDWEITSIEQSSIEVLAPTPVPAWHVTAVRR
jgi:SAM-dependent methyltransferase